MMEMTGRSEQRDDFVANRRIRVEQEPDRIKHHQALEQSVNKFAAEHQGKPNTTRELDPRRTNKIDNLHQSVNRRVAGSNPA